MLFPRTYVDLPSHPLEGLANTPPQEYGTSHCMLPCRAASDGALAMGSDEAPAGLDVEDQVPAGTPMLRPFHKPIFHDICG